MRDKKLVEQPMERVGVSVVVCTYNGAKRLSRTLAHLAKQEFDFQVKWEIIVVDNSSTDNTSEVARSQWSGVPSVEFRVIHEPSLGLSHARERGIKEAKYEVVSFVDDDNWVSSSWVQTVSEIMTYHSDIGACGGDSEAVCEIEPPWWFESVKGCYAVGQQGTESGDITETRGFLWGAGLNIRKSALQRLENNGFRSLLSDRRGKLLNSGGDQELCIALRTSGWRLWYDPRLRLHHFIPANRLEWEYLRQLMRGFGASTVGFDAYRHASSEYHVNLKSRIAKSWPWQIVYMINFLVRRHRLLLLSYNQLPEGDLRILDVEKDLGRLYELIKCRKSYRSNILAIRNAAWMRTERA